MTWNEIDGSTSTWTLPSARSKNHRALVTPLSAGSLEILDRQPKLGQYVFTVDGSKPFAGFPEPNGGSTSCPEVADWVLHDIRRSVATHLAETGIAAPHVIEKILNHTAGGVAAIYNRSQLMNERRDALEKWSAYVQGLVEGQVIPLRQRA